MKLEVIAPNGVNELARYQDFNYCRSGFHVDLGPVNQDGIAKQWLIPGESYTIPVYIKNSSSTGNYAVTNGRCTIRIISSSLNNQEIYPKETTGIAISPGDQLNLEETFVFNPVGTGDYNLEYAYEDETFTNGFRFRQSMCLHYWPAFTVTPDKAGYDLMDTANINVTINGLGVYTIQFNCPKPGSLKPAL